MKKKSKKIQVIIRIILTLALIYGVYTETGIWTAVSLGLIFVAIEALTIMINMIKSTMGIMNEIDSLLSKIFKRRLK